MKNVGLITFHSAYNFGSVLQTYATKIIIEKLGYHVDVINYRTHSSDDFYHSYLHKHFEKDDILRILNFFPLFFKHKEMSERFEAFITQYLQPKPVSPLYTLEELKKSNLNYDFYVSGSDQIWNEECLEFKYEPRTSILPYFLAFTSKPKISYASSLGGMTKEKMSKYSNYLSLYSALSCRENKSVAILEELSSKPVTNVIDPTLLLDRDAWNIDGCYTPNERDYLLWYALMSSKQIIRWLPYVKRYAKKHHLRVICLTPLSSWKLGGVKFVHNAGPIDFLSLVRHAKVVISPSFHGTVFSANLNIPFICCGATSNSRQGQILTSLGLQNQIVLTPQELESIEYNNCCFDSVNEKLALMRTDSIRFLRRAFEKCK